MGWGHECSWADDASTGRPTGRTRELHPPRPCPPPHDLISSQTAATHVCGYLTFSLSTQTAPWRSAGSSSSNRPDGLHVMPPPWLHPLYVPPLLVTPLSSRRWWGWRGPDGHRPERSAVDSPRSLAAEPWGAKNATWLRLGLRRWGTFSFFQIRR